VDKQTTELIRQYIHLISEKYPNLKSAWLFGSYARNAQHQDSDIDLALILENISAQQIFDIQVNLLLEASRIDSRIEPHPFCLTDFDESNPFAAEIIRTGKEIAFL
jgi:uncharacterized protein